MLFLLKIAVTAAAGGGHVAGRAPVGTHRGRAAARPAVDDGAGAVLPGPRQGDRVRGRRLHRHRARDRVRRAFHDGVRGRLHLRAVAGEPGGRRRWRSAPARWRSRMSRCRCHRGGRRRGEPRGRLPAAAASDAPPRRRRCPGGTSRRACSSTFTLVATIMLSADAAGPAPVGHRVDLSRHGDGGRRLHAPPVGARRRAPLAARHHAGAAGGSWLSSCPSASACRPSAWCRHSLIAAALVLAIDGMLLIATRQRA